MPKGRGITMVFDVRFAPVDNWPSQPTHPNNRKRPTFKVKWENVLYDLERELEYLGARSVVIMGYFTDDQIRLDGWPRGGASPSRPGIIVAFQSKHGPLKYVCDTYDEWRGNLRAISLTLTNLRAVDRYGATKRGEQYTGWKALPSARTDLAMTIDEAAELIAALSGASPAMIRMERETFDKAAKQAAAKSHPDAGGSHEGFVRVQEAKRVIETHYQSR